MSVRGWVNWILSGVGIGGAVFFTMAFQDCVQDRTKITAALMAAGAAMWAHLRANPVKRVDA